MRYSRFSKPGPELFLGLGLSLVLIALAVLQYRWIGQVSEADRSRLESNLRQSVDRFVQDADSELERFGRTMVSGGPPGAPPTAEDYAARLALWQETTAHQEMIRRIWYVDGVKPGMGRLLGAGEVGEPQTMDPALQGLLDRLQARRPGPGGGPGGPMIADGEIPALALPAMESARAENGSPRSWLIAELDAGYISENLLAPLYQRDFGTEYRVAITSRQGKVIYRSDADFDFSSMEPAASLLSIRPGPPGQFRPGANRFDRPREFGRGPGAAAREPPPRNPKPNAKKGPQQAQGGAWMLYAIPRTGSLEDTVRSLRRRNLAVSFGILGLMGASIGILVQSTRRAKRLARLQMEFVAGITHELRTPLAVISSAGQNLADGVAAKEEQVKRYGGLIRDQGRRLSEMVEQVLRFAGISAGRLDLRPETVEVDSLIQRAIADSEPDLAAAGVTLTQQIDVDLPAVHADAAATIHCLRNLLSNAAKYGAGSPVGVKASSDQRTVEIRVEDQGPGIDPVDLPHVFEPFYRGRRAIADQIHGTGLGLSLVRKLIEAQGGTVSVESEPGKGTSFAIRMPAEVPS